MSVRKPEDWPGLFDRHLNAGDLEAVMELYEPGARFAARSGETVVGRERIRPALAAMIDASTQLRSRVIKSVTIDDLAVLHRL
jgi:hypothetical protein